MMMRVICCLALGMFCSTALAFGQTAEELVAKNIEAKGGLANIKAITSRRVTATLTTGGFFAQVTEEAKAPGLVRETYAIQGMARIRAYNGRQAWQISPFEGRKDPELMAEDSEQRDLVAAADLHGPLVDYAAKGHTVEYLGHATVDGDDALRLKVTLKNGDIVYYYLDPDAYLEIREERQQFIRGAVHERTRTFGSYKRVNGVYMPFSIELTTPVAPNMRFVLTIEKIEANVDLPDAQFNLPATTTEPRQFEQ